MDLHRIKRGIARRVFSVLPMPGENAKEIHSLPAVQVAFIAPDLSPLEKTVTGSHGLSGTAGHALFLYNLVVQTRSQEIVEIGLGPGDSTCIFLWALRKTGGRLTSIDPTPQSLAEQKVNQLGLRDRWQYLQTFSEFVPETWAANRPIDILLIDGKHSYNQVKLEYRLFRPLMRPGGYMLFHDSETILGVRKFTHELARRVGGVQFPFANGLYVVRIP